MEHLAGAFDGLTCEASAIGGHARMIDAGVMRLSSNRTGRRADNSGMDVSVIIPTRGRAGKLAACLRGLDGQSLDRDRFEVLVGIDGDDEGASNAAAQARGGLRLGVQAFSPRGQAAVRNALLKHARGRLLVFLNDDMRPAPGLLAAHLEAHARASRPAIVAGDSPWVVHQPDRLFDRLIRETSMVFFHPSMREAWSRGERDRDWGFRHAWLLNLSIHAAAVREVGGLTVFPSTYGYEDDELAFRIAARFGSPVLFEPLAVAEHDHRMEPGEYLLREENLGFAAWGFARTTPDCARAMFGRDLTSEEEIEYSRSYVEKEEKGAGRLEAAFQGLAGLPAGSVNGPYERSIIELIYGQHLLLKRWRWRRGHLRAARQAASTPEPVVAA